jgi:glyoxylase I family protein
VTAPGEPKRLRIAGIHHITLLVRDAERAVAFYRNLLGMRLVEHGVNDDDPDARHLIFGDADGRPGTLVTCLEYPQLEEGKVGVGSTHHFALAVDSADELQGWRDYLVSRGVACTEVMERSFARSVYFRDPDGHIVELATGGPSSAAEPAAGG